MKRCRVFIQSHSVWMFVIVGRHTQKCRCPSGYSCKVDTPVKGRRWAMVTFFQKTGFHVSWQWPTGPLVCLYMGMNHRLRFKHINEHVFKSHFIVVLRKLDINGDMLMGLSQQTWGGFQKICYRYFNRTCYVTAPRAWVESKTLWATHDVTMTLW